MSAKQVSEALAKNKHLPKLYDLRRGLPPLKKISSEFDIIFPVIHGEEGEGGALHKFLTRLNKPIVGTKNHKALAKGWYKIPFKIFCEENNILTSPWKKVRTKKDLLKFGFPSVLKSSSGGSSREVVILKNKKDLNSYRIRKLFSSNLDLFVEKYLSGIEVTAGIFKNRALPLIEIIPPGKGWFDYKNKYWGKTREIPNTPSIDEGLKKEIQSIAEKIHNTLDFGSYSRIDFMVSNGKPYALEINSIPGLTASSLLPKAAAAAGISFPELVESLVNLAA